MGRQIISTTEVEDRLEQVCNKWRRLWDFVKSEKFKMNYEDGSDADREFMLTLIDEGDLPTLKAFMKNQRVLENFTIECLRELASGHKIPFYNSFTRKQLIIKIRRVRADLPNRNFGEK